MTVQEAASGDGRRPEKDPMRASRFKLRPTLTGVLIWLPFMLVATVLALISGQLLLAFSTPAWAVALALLGARCPTLVFGAYWQGTFSLTGVAYLGLMGSYPGGSADLQLIPVAVAALQLSTFIICLTFAVIAKNERAYDFRAIQPPNLKIGPGHLFLVCVVLFMPEWLGINLKVSATSGLRQLVDALFAFRYVLFAIFAINALRSRNKKALFLLFALTLYMAIPGAVTGGSGWAGPIILLIIIYAHHVTLNMRGARRIKVTSTAALAAAVSATLLLVGGMVWEGGLKNTWRMTLQSGGADLGVAERLHQIRTDASFVVSSWQLSNTLHQLSSRMSSGVGYSSLVMKNVPEYIPHTNGDRAKAAFINLIPRLIYKNKPNLGGDSFLVRQYAGVRVAGDEQGTSIGLGYVSELYIDFWHYGVFFGSIVIGAIFSLIMIIFRRVVKNPDLYSMTFLVVASRVFMNAEAGLSKMMPAAVVLVIVFSAILPIAERLLYSKNAWAPHPPARRAAQKRRITA